MIFIEEVIFGIAGALLIILGMDFVLAPQHALKFLYRDWDLDAVHRFLWGRAMSAGQKNFGVRGDAFNFFSCDQQSVAHSCMRRPSSE